MLAIITKASEDYWYTFKKINEVKDILEIYPSVIITPNDITVDEVDFWEGFKKEDIPFLEKAEIHILIYDSYIE